MWFLSVTDDEGCQVSDTVNISHSSSIEVNLSEDSTVNISGGTVPYDTVNSQSDDMFRVVVTDSNGCIGQDSFVSTPAFHALSVSVKV